MERFSPHEDLTLASRYECKYLVDPLRTPALREFIRPFTVPDPFNVAAGGRPYAICSLYLDSADLATYRHTEGGERDRFKLRVRSYSDDPAEPVFLEVKRKADGIVRKRRARVPRERVRSWLRGARPGHGLADDDPVRNDVDFFWSHQARIQARPVMRVRYRREAWESAAGDPVRVTFDTDLMHAVTLGDELGHAAGSWVATPIDGVILELKFTERFPPWMHDLVRCFGLKRRAVPKYGLAIEHLLHGGRPSALTFAGITLPPAWGG